MASGDFQRVAGGFQSGEPVLADNLGLLCQERFLAFLRSRRDVYEKQVGMMKGADEEHTTLYVDFEEVSISDQALAEGIQKNFYRFEAYLRKAVHLFIKEIDQDFVTDEKGDKEFFVAFYHMDFTRKIRDLRTERIGQLVSITGTVTRTTEVRPELLYGTFRCGECATDIEGVEQQFKYTEPKKCRNPVCNNRRVWDLDTDRSKFVDWQRIRVQENADEIPPGSMPRSLDVVVRGRNVEIAKAGDKCIFVGTLIVIPDVAMLSRGEGVAKHSRGGSRAQGTGGMGGVSGLKDLGVRDLTYRLAFLACSVECAGRPFSPEKGQEKLEGQSDVLKSFTLEQRREIVMMKESQQLYLKMARSLAPNVFGHEDVKRGILLMLLGGVHKKTKGKMSLRGDINVCIVGDPSTAKSQFLKYVTSLMPRCVYTSGKASSAAGLTASVAKDPDTGEFCIEAGALMLADNGICCIDEFDKMDDNDQVAIHEAMEQQTITITKAGIQATLNARASILAAANPIHGRYDRSKTLRQNVVMSPPIMSRFDVFFVVLDQCDENFDERMATHIVQMHQNKMPTHSRVDFTKEQIFRYIRYARSFNPKISPEAQKKMIDCYRRLRQKTLVEKSHQITVRQLESMIRLSEALARLYLDDTVRVEYVAEAHRLLEFTLKDIHSEKIDLTQIERDIEEARNRRRRLAKAREEATEEDSKVSSAAMDDTDAESVATKTTEVGSGDQGDVSSEDGGTQAMDESEDSEDEEGQLEVTYAKAEQVKRKLVLHIRETERKTDQSGVKQKDLVNWYLVNLEDEEGELEDMDELKKETRIVTCLIQRYVVEDGILQVVGDFEEGDEEERLLTVNPNFEC